MRRAFAYLLLITTFISVAAIAHADSIPQVTANPSVPTSSSQFSLLDPGSWKMAAIRLEFVQSPGSQLVAFHPGA